MLLIVSSQLISDIFRENSREKSPENENFSLQSNNSVTPTITAASPAMNAVTTSISTTTNQLICNPIISSTTTTETLERLKKIQQSLLPNNTILKWNIIKIFQFWCSYFFRFLTLNFSWFLTWSFFSVFCLWKQVGVTECCQLVEQGEIWLVNYWLIYWMVSGV